MAETVREHLKRVVEGLRESGVGRPKTWDGRLRRNPHTVCYEAFLEGHGSKEPLPEKRYQYRLFDDEGRICLR